MSSEQKQTQEQELTELQRKSAELKKQLTPEDIEQERLDREMRERIYARNYRRGARLIQGAW
jgi:hypothetical protein